MALMALGGMAPLAHAGQIWDGGNLTGLWGDANNWNPDGVANFGLGINFAGIVQPNTNNNITAITTGITFDVGAGAFTLAGNAVTNTGGITNNSASLQTINLPITLGNAQTWSTTGAGSMAFVGTVALFNGGQLQLAPANGTAVNVTGLISGGSAVSSILVNGAGTGSSTLSGANTYIGTTAINAGTLIVGNASALGTNAAGTNVQGAGTLDLNGFNIGTEPLNINGAGVGGNGALISSVGTGTVGGPAVLSGAATIGGAGSTTIDGQVSGLFALTKVGAGTLLLNNGGNNYLGTTTVNAGTLQVGTVGTVGSLGVGAVSVNNGSNLTITNGNVLNNNISADVGAGNVTVNSANNNTLNGLISNVLPGTVLNLTQSGSGRTTLTAPNTYTGTTNITAGSLNVLGSHIGGAAYTVGAASALSGTGIITLATGSNFNNNGNITVGNTAIANAPAILTISTSGAGAIIMGAGSAINVDLFTGAGLGNNTAIIPSSDRLAFTGNLNATAGGTVVVGNPNGMTNFTGGDQWTVLNNGGTVTGTLGLNDAALNLRATQVGNLNQNSGVYSVIDTITGLQMSNIMGQSILSAAQSMLSDVNGRLFFLRAGYGDQNIDNSISSSMNDRVIDGEGDGPGKNPGKNPVAASAGPQGFSSEWQAYANANYTNTHIDSLGAQQAGFEADTWSAGVGFDRRVSPNLILGFAVNWMESEQTYTNSVGTLDMSGIALSAYASYVQKAFWADLLYSYGNFDVNTARNSIGFPTANGDTTAQTHAVQFNTGLSFRYQDNTLVTGPFAGLDYMHASIDGFSESSGGIAALRFNQRNAESLISRIGWSVSKRVDTDMAVITGQLRLSYEHQFMDYGNRTSVSLVNQPFTATAQGQNPERDFLVAGAGVNFQFTPRVGLLLNYQGQFASESTTSHYFGLRLGVKF